MLKGLFERFKAWKDRRAWLRYQDFIERKLFWEYAQLQLKELKADVKRREEFRRLRKRILQRDSKKNYVV